LGVPPGAAFVGLVFALCVAGLLWLGLGAGHATLSAAFAVLPALALATMLLGGGHAFAAWLCGRWWGRPRHWLQQCVSFVLSLVGVALALLLMNLGGISELALYRGT
jgi:hypothetical protein